MIKKIKHFIRQFNNLIYDIDNIKQSLGRIELRQNIDSNTKLNDDFSEFKVYSQSGEDGIIQNLISKINIKNKIFIEFGVENYLESNTRFLLLNNYWSGLVIDGSKENINFIKNDPIYWRTNLKASCRFINKDNINEIISSSGVKGNIGLLSIDIDGNDYWVYKSIKVVDPEILVLEYNSFFGKDSNVTVPYEKNFIRDKAHYSKIYYGASISALVNLAKSRGFILVAVNNSGNNLFFVKAKYSNKFKELSIDEAYKEINFREAHDSSGKLIFKSFKESKKLINDLSVLDINNNELIKIKDL